MFQFCEWFQGKIDMVPCNLHYAASPRRVPPIADSHSHYPSPAVAQQQRCTFPSAQSGLRFVRQRPVFHHKQRKKRERNLKSDGCEGSFSSPLPLVGPFRANGMELAGRTLACVSWRGSDTRPSRLNAGGGGGYFNVVALQQKHALQTAE